MNIYLSVFLVLQLFGKISAHNIITNENEIIKKNNKNDKLNYMDVLMEDLLNHHWEKDESTCLNKLLNIMNNVKNSTLWAMWIWDSMQTPAGLVYGSQYNLGKYDQCMNSPWLDTHPEFRTQYCLADIQLSEADPINAIGDPYKSVTHHINSVTKYHLKFNRITWGICIPAECKINSTSKFVRSLFKYTHLGREVYNVKDVHHCQVSGKTAEYTWGLCFFILVITSAGIVTISCTIINNMKSNSNDDQKNKLLKAFCLKTNGSSLNKISKEDINVLHGLRSLTSYVVVAVHVFILSHSFGFGNGLSLDRDMDRLKIKSILRLDYTVDIFLLMSGLLRIKGHMSVGKIKPFHAILKRYLRYAVTVGVIILCIAELHNHIADGPIWTLMTVGESKDCKNNGLLSLLMIGNYVDNENTCYSILWTVACDFHLSVIATILYWIFQKNKKASITIYGILATASLILPGFVTYQKNWAKVWIFDFTIAKNYKKMMANSTYILSHLRAAPYLIGIALGYVMATYKPNRHRNIFSKLTSSIGIMIALAIAAINIYIVGSIQDNPDSNELSSYIYSSIHRSIFTLAICLIIVFCEYGNVPLLGSILTWPAFIPISKLSYGVYLIHCIVFSRMILTTRSPLHYDALLMFLYSLAAMSISCLLSVLIYLFVEAPINKITDIMIDIRAEGAKKDTNKTTIEYKNGVSKNGIKKNI